MDTRQADQARAMLEEPMSIRVGAVNSRDVIEQHRAAGRRFEAAGVGSFVREDGPAVGGEPVVCLHGVSASCFLYRKVLPELAARGLRGGRVRPARARARRPRPRTFDYTWTGLGRFCAAAVDALGLGRFHLVVHDIGGPVGFELAAAMPRRVASLTVLNTLVEVDTVASARGRWSRSHGAGSARCTCAALGPSRRSGCSCGAKGSRTPGPSPPRGGRRLRRPAAQWAMAVTRS